MKAAVLGNGPSRFLFANPSEYDYVIGCNVPWTSVNSNVIIDESMVNYWFNIRNRYQYPHQTFFSEKAWAEIVELDAVDYFKPYTKGIVPINEGVDSSAHTAVKILLDEGKYKTIHIFGADSRWSNNITSRTREYCGNVSPNKTSTIDMWNREWNNIISSNPDVEIIFIGEPK